jgi:hypothetical protein
MDHIKVARWTYYTGNFMGIFKNRHLSNATGRIRDESLMNLGGCEFIRYVSIVLTDICRSFLRVSKVTEKIKTRSKPTPSENFNSHPLYSILQRHVHSLTQVLF